MTSTNTKEDTSIENEVDEKLNNISTRLSFVEGKLSIQGKSKIKKLSDFGGLIALCISILIGGYTIYDKFIAGPTNYFEAKHKNIIEQLGKLVSIRANISALDWNSDSIGAQNQANVWFPQQISVLDEVQQFFEEYPNLAKYENYMLITKENETLGRNQLAMKFALMTKKITTNQGEIANIHWTIGRLGGKLGNVELMRTSYRKSINGFKILGSEGNGRSILSAYTEWIFYELLIPNCSAVKDLYSEYKGVYSADYIYPKTRGDISKTFIAMKSSVREDCNIDFSNHIGK
jgi:hypothetical protein